MAKVAGVFGVERGCCKEYIPFHPESHPSATDKFTKKARPALLPRPMVLTWQLAGQDAAVSYMAMCSLAAAPSGSVPFLKSRLQPSPEINQERLKALLTNLASGQFAVRQTAFNELKELGETISDALRQALADNPALEVKRRVELLLDAARMPRPETLRRIRAIEVLEYIGSDDARQTLAALAGGFSDTRETRDARAALGRLSKRTKTAR